MEGDQGAILNFGLRKCINKEPHFLPLNECESKYKGTYSIVVRFINYLLFLGKFFD